MNIPVAPMIGIGENFFCRLDEIKKILIPEDSDKVIVVFRGDEKDTHLNFGEGVREIIRGNLKGSMPNLADGQYLAKLKEEIERMKEIIAQQRTAPTVPQGAAPQGFSPGPMATGNVPDIPGLTKPKTDIPDTEK